MTRTTNASLADFTFLFQKAAGAAGMILFGPVCLTGEHTQI
jgi:hypothetical protein